MDKIIIECANSSKSAQFTLFIITLFLGLITCFLFAFITIMIIQIINAQYTINKDSILNFIFAIIFFLLILKFNITFFLDFLSYNYIIEFNEYYCEYKFYILKKLIYKKKLMIKDIKVLYKVKRKYINITDRPIIIITILNKFPIILNTIHLTEKNFRNLLYSLRKIYQKEISYVTGIRAFLYNYIP